MRASAVRGFEVFTRVNDDGAHLVVNLRQEVTS